MRKKKEMQTKTLAAVMAASMVTGLCPTTVFAVTGEQVAKDGVYTEKMHVVNNPDDENEWTEYDITVSLTVADGKFSNIVVTPDNGYDSESDSYFKKAYNKSKGFQTLLIGAEATEQTINKWDTVSGATRTSEAIKQAALNAIHAAEEKQVQAAVDTKALDDAIARAKELVQADYTEDSWSEVQKKLTEAQTALEKKESQEAVTTAASELTAAIDALVKKSEVNPVEKPEYVLMNIPYAKFYEAEVNNSIPVDAFSSATLNKTRTASLAGGSYHVNADGSDITGITFPVKLTKDVDLSAYKKVTDQDLVEITVTNRGQTSTTVYTGQDALFENDSYAYYVLEEAPSYYKEATVNADGSLSFGKAVGEVQTLNEVEAELSTDTGYGDYQLDLDGLELDADKIYAVTISTKEGNDYGLRHLENIWRTVELAWSTGFTASVHNCPTSSGHYKAMMGQTINKVTYYTNKGIYEILLDDIYVPEKFESTLKVENASLASGSTKIELTGLPSDYDPQYSVEGLDIEVRDGVLSFNKDADKGKYTLTISDKSGRYADLTTDFILYTEDMPAAYNEDNSAPALVAAKGFTEEDFKEYVGSITSVSVNEKSYAASGRGAVEIIGKDGNIKTDAAPIKEEGEYEITVSATGYQELKFTYTKAAQEEYKYVYAGLSWAEYWAAEGVLAAGDTSSSDEKDSKGETDKGAFDTVSRATTNHGLHRGSYQSMAVIYDTDGKTYEVSYWTSANEAVLTDGLTINFSKGTITAADGSTAVMDHYEVTGIKYVPVKVKTEDYEEFCRSYPVTQNDETVAGGYTENNLSAYSATAQVTEETNGLKTAEKNEDGTFRFLVRATGSGSGLKDTAQKTAEGIDVTVKEASGSYGEFLRVDLNGNYGDLAANMYAVRWTYYGDDSSYTTPLESYGTKFAADNWMHKSNGIQLGLTDSLRCQLPKGTDGTGYWALTVYAMGYQDYTIQFQATEENIVKPAEEEVDTTELEAAIAKAEALNAADYTPQSWASSGLETELAEAKEELEKKNSQAAVDEALSHLNAAMEALIPVMAPVIDTSALEEVISAAGELKESDYTKESWDALQEKLAAAQEALNNKESQDTVDAAESALRSAIEGLVEEEKPETAVDTDALQKVITQAKSLKESDYTADTWKTLQAALAKAEAALEAKESQSAVDAAAKELQSAIDGLKKKTTSPSAAANTSGKGNSGTTNTGNSSTANTGKASSSGNVKTGDVTNIWGWVSLAVSSLGIGGVGLKVRRKSKRKEK